MTPVLTIGMPVFNDYRGVAFTLQSLRLHHPEILERIQFVVVDDSNVKARHTELGVQLLSRVQGSRYLTTPGLGPALAKQRVFEAALTPWVMCIDSHVLLAPGSLKRLLEYLDTHPTSNDLLQGPILHDTLTGYDTHFNDEWRGTMWGTWGADPRGGSPDNPPFEIGAMGMGLFVARKEAWNTIGGFNLNLRGFGGEEWYIHTKFRRAGFKCLCLPFLRWWHLFDTPEDRRPYPHTTYQNARNYVIELTEIGFSLEPLYQAYVEGGKISPQLWERLMTDVTNPPLYPSGEQPQPTVSSTPEEASPSRRKIGRIVLRPKSNPVSAKSLSPQTTEQPPPPQQPSLLTQAWNLVRAMGEFISDGMTMVDAEEYKHRLTICEPCENRDNNRCKLCGCHLAIKAKGRAFNCPINKWNASNPSTKPQEPLLV